MNAARIYPPMPSHTGWGGFGEGAIRPGCRYAFTPDYEVAVDMTMQMDAPLHIPCGSVRSTQVSTGDNVHYTWSHVWRPGSLEPSP